ncbi:MAG TPA: hypothetical protein VFB79_04200 [Candidatus Angelobacter sp.]|nr:hypothetical protein [Candidatus Angelobacter sp.]
MMLKNALPWLNTCANPGCQAKSLHKRFLSSGAYLGEARYCSPECFQIGLVECFAHLTQQPRSMPTRRQHRIPLGLELISRGCIHAQTLKLALQKQKEEPETRLGQILMRMEAVTEEQITAAIASQWSVPVFRLDPNQVPEAAHLVPFSLIQRYKMVPVHFSKQTNKLHLAFAQVLDRSILYAIEKMLGVRTEACIADESALQRVILNAGSQERPAEYVLNSLSRGELVSMIAGYALRLRAEKVFAANCNDQIWVRAVAKNEVTTHFLTSILPLHAAAVEADIY